MHLGRSPDEGFGVHGRNSYNFGLTSPGSQFLLGATFADAGIIACGSVAVSSNESDDLVLRLLDDLLFADCFE